MLWRYKSRIDHILHHRSQGQSKGGHMAAAEQVEARSRLSKVVLYATVISGFVAAYLMYRRGESMVSIARKTVTNPVGSLVSEVKNVV
jgi:hypothetical protein